MEDSRLIETQLKSIPTKK